MKTDADTRASVVRELAAGFGFPPREIDAVINIESGWHWDAVNPKSGAEGLIQIMPFNIRRWKKRRGYVRRMRPKQQLEPIARFFREANARWLQPGDTYLSVAAPAALGKPNPHVVYPVGSDAWEQNPVWRESPEGPITAGSIRQLLLSRMRTGKGLGEGLQPPKPKRRSRLPAWAWLLLAGAAAEVAFREDR